MNETPVTDALTRVERLLFESPVLESFIARREAGRTEPGDGETANALVEELLAHQQADGSWGGVRATAEALLLLRDLRPFDFDADERVHEAIAWLRSQQGAPGNFADSCTPDRHDAGLCSHFAGGFFSPGSRAHSLAGSILADGTRLPSDEDARLAHSSLALRAVLSHQQPSFDDRLHGDALLRLADLLFRGASSLSTSSAVTVLGTLALARRSAGHTAILHGALSRLAGLQRADGSWPGAEGFHVADAFLIAVQAGYGSPLFDKAIVRTAEALLLSLHDDGSWGESAGPQRLLLGWRALRYAAGCRSLKHERS